MTPGKINGATSTLGAPEGWDAGRFGECEPLEVRAAECPETGAYGLQSAWYPNEEEKAAIAAGLPVVLTVWGKGHPPVSLNVEPHVADVELADGEDPPSGCVEITALTDMRGRYLNTDTGRTYLGEVLRL